MPQAQVVSINKARQNAVLVWRGFFTLAFLPSMCLLLLILSVVRDLPQVNLALLRSPLVWLIVGLTVAGGVAAHHGTARMTAPYLWILVLGSSLIAIGGAVFVVNAGTGLAREPVGESLGLVAVFLFPIALMFTWLLLLPTVAALRLIATRVPPDDTPLTTVLASPRLAGNTVAAAEKRSGAAIVYGVAAVMLGIVAVALVLWLLTTERMGQMAVAFALEIVAIYFVTVLWRRRRKHAAIDAHAAMQSDPRPVVLYLRSFQDDPHMMDTEWDILVRTGYGRAGRRRQQGPVARLVASMPTGLLSTSGGRLEERLKAIVAPIGPFVAFGVPGEPLPQLGAARAYFTNDAWQSAVIEWVDRAQLIIWAAGPSPSVRWEFQTILDRNAWPKLLVLIPPAAQQDDSARWDNIVSELQDRPWRDALAGLDPQQVVAMRLLEGGELAAVTSDRRRMVDYLLATRIMLHQMRTAVHT